MALVPFRSGGGRLYRSPGRGINRSSDAAPGPFGLVSEDDHASETMSESEAFLDLVGTVYDAALDPALWPDALQKLAKFAGGSAAAIYAKSPTAGSGIVYHQFGTDSHFRKLYFDRYVKVDPSTTAQYFAEVGQQVAVADIMPYDEFVETQFFREWCRPQGIVDAVSVVLDKSASSVALFGVFRYEREGIVDDTMRQRMALVIPHVRRAVLIGDVLNSGSAETSAFAETLNGLDAGVYLVNRNAGIVFANTIGQIMLREGNVVGGEGDVLRVADREAETLLRNVVVSAAGGDDAIGTKGIAVPLTGKDGSRYVAHVLPLTSGARRTAGMAFAAAVALFIRKTAAPTSSAPEVMARAFRLTPTELRVLLAVVEVDGLAKVAENLGMAPSTVKTHLGRVFQKTGAVRQADLVRLVEGYSTPLRREP